MDGWIKIELRLTRLLILISIWLSKGNALQCVWLLREELDIFLEKLNTDHARSYSDLLRDEMKVANMAFL